MSELGLIHQRQLDLKFCRREDGLFEIVGHLLDSKTHPFRRQLETQDTPAGAPIHDITVSLVVDDNLLIHDATATLTATPFDICCDAAYTLAPLKGLTIGAGWYKRIRELLSGAACCSHIVELLGPMATTAFQGLAPQRLALINEPANENLRLTKVDSCFAYAGEREVVARLWPHLHRQP